MCDIVYSVWYVILSTLNPNRKSQACTVNRLTSRQWSHEAQRLGKLLQLHRLYLVVSFLPLRINISIKHKTTHYTKDWTTDQQKRQFLFWFLSLVFQRWNYERKLYAPNLLTVEDGVHRRELLMRVEPKLMADKLSKWLTWQRETRDLAMNWQPSAGIKKGGLS